MPILVNIDAFSIQNICLIFQPYSIAFTGSLGIRSMLRTKTFITWLTTGN